VTLLHKIHRLEQLRHACSCNTCGGAHDILSAKSYWRSLVLQRRALEGWI